MMKTAYLQQLNLTLRTLARAKLIIRGAVLSKRSSERKIHMKISQLMKSVTALAIGAAFPIAAMAAPPVKTMTERGIIEKVNDSTKELALKGGSLKRPMNFAWNESTRFLENGKPVAASNLKMGERATVSYAKEGKQLVATSIAISPSGKAAQTHKSHTPAPHS